MRAARVAVSAFRPEILPAEREQASLTEAVPLKPATLLKRRDFIAASRARRTSAAGFILQGRRRREGEGGDLPRIGYTCSKKVGNAVARNRAKRRLRAIAAEIMPFEARAGWDYVLIGRKDVTAERDFRAMLADLSKALSRVHAEKAQ